MYDIDKVRGDFPILSKAIYGNRPLVYLDNAATTQKPRQVVEAMTEEYFNANANVHRGVHFLSQQATALHEGAREAVRAFLNARSTREIVFTRGTTESINLVASSYGQAFLREGDEVIVTLMEHHSNIVPWQMLAQRQGLRLRAVPLTPEGELDMQAFRLMLSGRTRLVALAHASNVLGTLNDIAEVISLAHAQGVPVLVDGAQSAPHMPIDVQALDCDFYALSGHKLYGPTGIGVLYGKESLLEAMPPYMGGGEMIKTVSMEHTSYADLPFKFEAGTPDYIASTGLARAIAYLQALTFEAIEAHEQKLTAYACDKLSEIPSLTVYGKPSRRIGVVSFNAEGVHHLDLGTLLDRLGIAVRTGHHCAEPLVRSLGVQGTCRASFALYNTFEEADALAEGIRRALAMLR